jgi:hypothetical protein
MRTTRARVWLLLRLGALALGLMALAWLAETDTAAVDGGAIYECAMYECPDFGKWSLAAWAGDDLTPAEEAFDDCGADAVGVAYALDRESQLWLRWFGPNNPLNTLVSINMMDGVFAMGGFGLDPSDLTDSFAPPLSPNPPTVLPPETDTMHGCPLPGKWSIAVWGGGDLLFPAPIQTALDTCGAGAVSAAYALDWEGRWHRWLRGREESSDLTGLTSMQAVLAFGAWSGLRRYSGEALYYTTSDRLGVDEKTNVVWLEFDPSVDGPVKGEGHLQTEGFMPTSGACFEKVYKYRLDVTFTGTHDADLGELSGTYEWELDFLDWYEFGGSAGSDCEEDHRIDYGSSTWQASLVAGGTGVDGVLHDGENNQFHFSLDLP